MVLAVATASGCVADTRPSPAVCSQPAITVDATLTDAGLEPPNLDVCRGQVLKLAIASEREGFVHIHGYDEQSVEIRPGETVSLQFAAERSGEFPIELHTRGESAGIHVGVFTVHEP
jgi:hypothetical protein